MALSPEIKKEIQSAYTQWLNTNKFRPRHSQRQMIATVANTIGGVQRDEGDARQGNDGSHIALVEAGTGTGKTVAYLLPAIILARHLNKKLVIATATINLQEQLMGKDIPDLAKSAGLEFDYALAKGRARYLCLSKLHMRLEDSRKNDAANALFPDEQSSLSTETVSALNGFAQEFDEKGWDGDRDSFSGKYDESAFQLVAADGVTCTGRKCQYFSQCPLFRAREHLLDADLIVANHDLLLANQITGGGILPPIEESILIFDEAHHLPEKSRNRQSKSLSLRAEITTLSRTKLLLARLASVKGLPAATIKKAENRILEIDAGIQSTLEALNPAVFSLQDGEAHQDEYTYRFPFGQVQPEIAELMGDLAGCYALKTGQLVELEKLIDDNRQLVAEQHATQLDALLASLSQVRATTENAEVICLDYGSSIPAGVESGPPAARWLEYEDQGVLFHSVPLSTAVSLREHLWDKCFASVLTSATLAALGSFASFLEKTGCQAQALQGRLLGELNYQGGIFHVPKMQTDPGRALEHTEEIISLIPDLLHPEHGSLVLFSSYRQMEEVRTALSPVLGDALFVQGSLSKQELVKRHRARVDDGLPSVIFGLASFSEGIDLPGKYCEQVIIAKLPFSVPDTPTEQAFSEWIEQKGGNSFYELVLPETSMRLVQACGRLLRNEQDVGRISLLDNRIVSKRYGDALISALPPFRLQIAAIV